MYSKIQYLLASIEKQLHLKRSFDRPELARELFDTVFSSPFGLGPGYSDRILSKGIHRLGFSHVCIGPLSEAGKEDIKERLAGIACHDSKLVLAIEIAPDPVNVTEEEFVRDCLNTFTLSYDYASFFILDFHDNPLGAAADLSFISSVAGPILDARIIYDNYKPVLLSLPDGILPEELDAILSYCRMNGIDGIVSRSAAAIRQLNQNSSGRFPLIGRCRFSTPGAVDEMLDCGASLVEMTEDTLPQGIISVKSILKRI